MFFVIKRVKLWNCDIANKNFYVICVFAHKNSVIVFAVRPSFNNFLKKPCYLKITWFREILFRETINKNSLW